MWTPDRQNVFPHRALWGSIIRVACYRLRWSIHGSRVQGASIARASTAPRLRLSPLGGALHKPPDNRRHRYSMPLEAAEKSPLINFLGISRRYLGTLYSTVACDFLSSPLHRHSLPHGSSSIPRTAHDFPRGHHQRIDGGLHIAKCSHASSRIASGFALRYQCTTSLPRGLWQPNMGCLARSAQHRFRLPICRDCALGRVEF